MTDTTDSALRDDLEEALLLIDDVRAILDRQNRRAAAMVATLEQLEDAIAAEAA